MEERGGRGREERVERGAVEGREGCGRVERAGASWRKNARGSAVEARADAGLRVGREGREVLRGERAEGPIG